MLSLLFFGFFIGMRHALEADHLAAVAAISTKEHTLKASMKHGAIWGIGHTITLFLFGSFVLLLNMTISTELADFLEFIVGVMLIGLGLDVLRRLIKERIHFHVHQHDDATIHFHAHSHQGEGDHDKSTHQHSHASFPFRTLFIGFMHGLAGSAALILLTLDTSNSLPFSLLYILLFGLGSVVGMMIISTIITVPLRASKQLTWLHNSLQAGVGIFTLVLGSSILYYSDTLKVIFS